MTKETKITPRSKPQPKQMIEAITPYKMQPKPAPPPKTTSEKKGK